MTKFDCGLVIAMGDGLLSTILLICAVLASLAVGVLIAHGVCVGLFAMFRTHSQRVAAARVRGQQPARLEAMRG